MQHFTEKCHNVRNLTLNFGIKQEMPVVADKSPLGAMVGKEVVVVADEKAGGAAGLPVPYPAVRMYI
jgi:hypothetical protein